MTCKKEQCYIITTSYAHLLGKKFNNLKDFLFKNNSFHALKYKITKIFDWMHFHVTLINSPMSKMHKPFADFLLNVMVLQKPSLYSGCIALGLCMRLWTHSFTNTAPSWLIMRETSYCCWLISDYPYFSILAISSVVPYQYHQPFCYAPLPAYTVLLYPYTIAV